MSENKQVLVQVESLKKYFPVRGQKDKFVRAIDGIDFTLAKGKTLDLVGESGSGKSEDQSSDETVPPEDADHLPGSVGQPGSPDDRR